MSEIIKISCDIDITEPSVPLGLEVWVDDYKFVGLECATPQHLSIEVPNADDGKHVLRFVMKNKTLSHTQIDATGNIVKDAVITITNLTFDEIALGHAFIELAEYTHDFNGTRAITTDKFYGVMGCNGTLSLGFTTPIYLWLLEKM